MTDFKTIPLKEIKPDPNQPRKYYDELAMQELTESIKQKGVLQPILIRPNGTGYVLVCGERRFKASSAAGLNEIPAVIRKLSDDEALELQIIENLQRKDVHPMEEAVAFKSLLENKNRKTTVEEVAAKVGKTVYYVRQRNRLNSLTKEWQDVFYRNKITVSQAMMIGSLVESEQAKFYKDVVRVKQLNDAHYFVEYNSYQIGQLRRELKNAPFDTKDETLSPLGACTTCPFNSAVSSLFPDDAKNPVCNNAADFQLKCDKSFDIKFKEVLEDPAIVLIYNYARTDADRKLIEKLKKEHKIYETGSYGDLSCNVRHSPDKKEIESGKLVKGFYIAGYEKGRIVWVQLNKSKPSSAGGPKAADKIKEGKASAADIDSEIQRVRDREKRSKELDAEKVHKEILSAANEHDAFKKPGLKIQPIDRTIMLYLLLNEVQGVRGYGSKNANEIIKIPDAPYGGHSYQEAYFKKLETITDDQLAFIIRYIIKKKWGNAETVQGLNADHAPMYFIAEYLGIDIAGIKNAQKEIADKRSERVNKRIADLQLIKKTLQEKPKPSPKKESGRFKPGAKKSAPKKAAKKK
jgi:ParB/RepB/Spo0J family partition protein